MLTTVIPVYNGEKHLLETLVSVASQTRRPDRLIILDNRSTDGTRKIVQNFQPMTCEWIQNERNLGLFGNLNRSLDFAGETEVLHILHADDLISPTFYELSFQAFQGCEGRSLLYCLAEYIDSKGGITGRMPACPNLQPRKFSPQEFIAYLAELKPVFFAGVLLRTAYTACDASFRLDLPQSADYVFWANWAKGCGQIVEVPEYLCQYRIHGDACTAANSMNAKNWAGDEWRSMELISGLLAEKGLSKQTRQLRLKMIFACRSRVKLQQVGKVNRELADQIRSLTCEIVGRPLWLAAGMVVAARDRFAATRRVQSLL